MGPLSKQCRGYRPSWGFIIVFALLATELTLIVWHGPIRPGVDRIPVTGGKLHTPESAIEGNIAFIAVALLFVYAEARLLWIGGAIVRSSAQRMRATVSPQSEYRCDTGIELHPYEALYIYVTSVTPKSREVSYALTSTQASSDSLTPQSLQVKVTEGAVVFPRGVIGPCTLVVRNSGERELKVDLEYTVTLSLRAWWTDPARRRSVP